MSISCGSLTGSVFVDLLNWVATEKKCIHELISVQRRAMANTYQHTLRFVGLNMPHKSKNGGFNGFLN